MFAHLLGKGADASANGSAALKLVIENKKLRVAKLLINANAQVADLTTISLHYVIDAYDWDFLIILLQRGVTMDGLKLYSFQSDDFFIFITPDILLRDGAGELLPKTIREERIRFVLDAAEMMKADPEFARLSYGQEEKLALRIGEFFQENQASS